MSYNNMTLLMYRNYSTSPNDSTLDLGAINIVKVSDTQAEGVMDNLQNASSLHYLRPYSTASSSQSYDQSPPMPSLTPIKTDGLISNDRSNNQSNELCHICGDRASGFHYNAFSCEGCKGFFRRSITRGAVYTCKYGGNCEMDMWMRRKCQSCRLRRCKEVGMKEECLLSEDQCKARDARRKVKRFINSMNRQINSPYPSSVGAGTDTGSSSSDQLTDDSSSQGEEEMTSPMMCNPLEMLTDSDRELIEMLVTNQDKFEVPSQKDIESLPNMEFVEGAGILDVSDCIFRRMASMTILVTKLVVEVAKRLPGFKDLDKDDQIVLLKGSASEVMVLRTARRYDPGTDSVVFGDGLPFTRTSMKFGGLQDYVDDMFEFSRGMVKLGVDNTEYALLTAACIFSDRAGLTQASRIEEIQMSYITTLKHYLKVRRPNVSAALARLLMKLVDLRTLSSKHGEVLKSLKVEKGSLPPLLSEYFDLFD